MSDATNNYTKTPSSLLSTAQAAALNRQRKRENIKAKLNCTDEELDSILEILFSYHAAGIPFDINALVKILNLPKFEGENDGNAKIRN